jgi:hypothetical protein
MADAADDDQAQPGGTVKGVTEQDRDDELEPGAGEESPAGDDGVGRRIGRFLTGMLGAFTLVGGLTWILLNLSAPEPVTDVLVGVVLAAGGLILLMPHRIRLPRTAAWITAAVTGVAGSAAGVLASSAYLCCMFAYVVQRGFPFRWLSRSGVADDPDTARRLAGADGWHADVPTLAMNVLVWAYAGLVVLAVITGIRRLRARR